MCKLCNTDSPPAYVNSIKYADKLKVVKQYIGTYPCRQCTHQLMTWSRATNDSTPIVWYCPNLYGGIRLTTKLINDLCAQFGFKASNWNYTRGTVTIIKDDKCKYTSK